MFYSSSRRHLNASADSLMEKERGRRAVRLRAKLIGGAFAPPIPQRPQPLGYLPLRLVHILSLYFFAKQDAKAERYERSGRRRRSPRHVTETIEELKLAK
jgi:hypothetical protein